MPPVFIVGVGRSGTTLLMSMLAAHPELALPPETQWVRRYLATGELESLPSWDAAVARITSDPAFDAWNLEVREALGTDPPPPGRARAAHAFDRLWAAWARTQGASRFGEKDPRSIEYLHLLHRHWPAAWVVHIHRDPRDVLASKKKAAWSRDQPVLRHVFAGRVQATLGRRHGPRLFGDRYLEVQYERLLEDPERELTRLCRGLQLTYDPAMLCFHEAAAGLVRPDERQWKSRVLGGLDKKRRGTYRESLSAFEIRAAELASSELMRLGQHAPHDLGWADLPARAAAHAVDLAMRPAAEAYVQWRTRTGSDQ